jgi:aspartyl-tRNA(Asn)/glutamyl-tRNA(Gln) amidotransferase subunit B
MVTQVKNGWELVVGLEVHVELNTRSKMWCGCATDFGGEPNTRVCPVCTGQPGALPVVNGTAVESAARLGLALNCSITELCRFHRKNYFYPDMPKNYQISQYDIPLCADGHLDVEVEGDQVRVRIERLHMEEDTGKSLHVGDTGRLHGADRSLIDYNRAGIPLLEIVSRPDIHDPETAQAYLRELQGVVQTLGVSDARMEEGSIRCDANVSVNRPGEGLGTRREIKNLNSVRSLGRAIAYEADVQIDTLEDGGTIVMETRHWDEERGVTETLRRKESVADYRYFPDPDLVEIHSAREWVEALRQTLPELPVASRARLADAGIPVAQAQTIVTGGMLPWYDHAVATGADPRTVANWVSGEVTGQISAAGLDPATSGITGAHVGQLVTLIEEGRLSNTLAKEVLEAMIAERGRKLPAQIAEERGIEQVSDEGELKLIVDEIVAGNPDVVDKIRGGADRAIGALVGQVMKATKGQANPGLANQLLRDAIGSGDGSPSASPDRG